jgi:hypothetical protein
MGENRGRRESNIKMAVSVDIGGFEMISYIL